MMHTQCPKCRTIFRVTEDILAVKAGLVRCGDCDNVFNASWNLVEEPAQEHDGEPPAQPQETPEPEESGDAGTADQDDAGNDAEPDLGGSAVAAEGTPEPQPARHPWAPDYDDFEDAPAGIDDLTDEEILDLAYDDRARPEQAVDQRTTDISDEEIRRTLHLDEALDFDSDGPDAPTTAAPAVPGSPPADDRQEQPGERTWRLEDEEIRGQRVEPRLGPAEPPGLSVSAEDRLLPGHRPGGRDQDRARPSLARRPAVRLKAPKREPAAEPAEVEPARPVERSDPNVHWVSIPERADRGANLMWASGVLVAIVLVLMQVRYLLVDELYSIPSTRPYIAMFCGIAGCEAPMRTAPGSIAIAQTRVDLHPEVPGAIRIKVNLINRADFPQPYPALTLVLTDKDGRIVGRRTYAAREYLESGQEKLLDPGILAVASINLAHPNENAVGFETGIAGAGG